MTQNMSREAGKDENQDKIRTQESSLKDFNKLMIDKLDRRKC
jgi:hypothetical protein